VIGTVLQIKVRDLDSIILDIYRTLLINNMASDQNFVDFIIGQLQSIDEITYKKMFGEYALYARNKIFALICDNKLFIKPTLSGRNYILDDLVEVPPYTGAKPMFLIEDKIEDHEWLSNLVKITIKELPEPKPKTKKKK
jgi:TfoX/Sxy family transcriptional regulator of competence genes